MKIKKPTVHTPEEILAELRALVAEAEAMVDHTLDQSDDVVATLRARYEAAQERLLDAYAEAKRKAVAGAAYADDAIRERPYTSLAIAAGAGLVLGLIVAMRKSRYTAALIAMLVVAMGGLSLAAQGGRPGQYGQQGGQMSGTYELETTRGDNAQQVADMATRNLPQGQRDRAYQDLLNRLQAPTSLAIERTGRTFTISSSNGPRVSFDADGRTRNEPLANRRVTATRVELIGNRLVVTSRGNRMTDFTVTFEPTDGGNGLLVTRQMDRDDLRKPAVIRSYYRRVADQPRWDVYRADPRDDRGGAPSAFVVPEGTRINAILDSPISTRSSRDGERFTMTVQGPGEYRDARIDGTIQRISPYGGGRNAEMRVDFDTIRLRDGQTAQFDGVLTAVRTPNGVSFRVNSENVPPSNTQNTVQSGAVGAALGAIIGAIAGGGKGAAIGAVVGGAGGVIVAQDRDQYLDLPPGTEVTLVVTSRRNR
jgi:ElaB/YqjD/DUF883 family membrane-anchored ribosome-binding protein